VSYKKRAACHLDDWACVRVPARRIRGTRRAVSSTHGLRVGDRDLARGVDLRGDGGVRGCLVREAGLDVEGGCKEGKASKREG